MDTEQPHTVARPVARQSLTRRNSSLLHQRHKPLYLVFALMLQGCIPLFSLEGQLEGLQSDSRLVISLNGRESLYLKSNGHFAFQSRLMMDMHYHVNIVSQPQHHDCQIESASGQMFGNIETLHIRCRPSTDRCEPGIPCHTDQALPNTPEAPLSHHQQAQPPQLARRHYNTSSPLSPHSPQTQPKNRAAKRRPSKRPHQRPKPRTRRSCAASITYARKSLAVILKAPMAPSPAPVICGLYAGQKDWPNAPNTSSTTAANPLRNGCKDLPSPLRHRY